MSIDIGGRLRYVRMRQNLSQRELAKRAGVTNSTISPSRPISPIRPSVH